MLDENLRSVTIIPVEWPPWKSQTVLANDMVVVGGSPKKLLRPWTPLHQLLFLGDVDLVTGKRISLWSNTLVLPNIDVIDHSKFDTEAKIAALPQTLSLRGRQLEGAVLIGAHLRKVDFTAARLKGAVLYYADMREAKAGCDREGPRIGAPICGEFS